MTTYSQINLEPFKVDVINVYLVHARYLDTVPPSEEPGEVDADSELKISMAFDRQAVDYMTIALTARVDIKRPYRVEVMYAAEFVMDDDVPPEDRDNIWKQAAARVAPVVLYPYVREMIDTLTRRGRAADFVLPVLGFTAWDPSTFQIPPAPEG